MLGSETVAHGHDDGLSRARHAAANGIVRIQIAGHEASAVTHVVGMPGLSIGTIPLVTVFTCQNLFIESQSLSQICDRERPTAACIQASLARGRTVQLSAHTSGVFALNQASNNGS